MSQMTKQVSSQEESTDSLKDWDSLGGMDSDMADNMPWVRRKKNWEKPDKNKPKTDTSRDNINAKDVSRDNTLDKKGVSGNNTFATNGISGGNTNANAVVPLGNTMAKAGMFGDTIDVKKGGSGDNIDAKTDVTRETTLAKAGASGDTIDAKKDGSGDNIDAKAGVSGGAIKDNTYSKTDLCIDDMTCLRGGKNVSMNSGNDYRHEQERLNEDNTAPLLERRPIVYVGIYLGEGRSGSAFRFEKDGCLSSIIMNQSWVTEHGISTSTVPTVLLTDVEKQSSLFGIEALTNYTAVADLAKYVLRWPTQIQFSKTDTDNTCPEAEQFLSDVLKCLRQNVEQQLYKLQLWSTEHSQEIRYIITCSSIMMHDLSLEFLEQALKSQYVALIPEDEAAALWCAEVPIYELTDTQNPSLETGAYFGLLDIDHKYCALFAKTNTMKVDKLLTQSLKIDLNYAYEQLLSEVFDTRTGGKIEDYQVHYPRDWLKILNDIDIQMNNANAKQDMRIILTLPYTFLNYFKNVSTFESKSVSLTSDLKLVIKHVYFRCKFNTYAQQVLFLLCGWNTSTNCKILYLFLIGKSLLLKKSIEVLIKESTFSKLKIEWIKEPEDSCSCALRGAVLTGHKRFDVNQRE